MNDGQTERRNSRALFNHEYKRVGKMPELVFNYRMLKLPFVLLVAFR